MRFWLAAATPSPSPSLRVTADSVTPGVVGFGTMALITIVAVLLIMDMVRRVRRVRYRGELAERRAAAAAAQQRDRPAS